MTNEKNTSMRDSVKDVKYIDIHAFDTTPVYGAKFDFYDSLSFDGLDNLDKPGIISEDDPW